MVCSGTNLPSQALHVAPKTRALWNEGASIHKHFPYFEREHVNYYLSCQTLCLQTVSNTDT